MLFFVIEVGEKGVDSWVMLVELSGCLIYILIGLCDRVRLICFVVVL